MTDQPQDYLSLSVRDFVAATAARTPTPGGGSVAGVAGALGAALGHMALGFTQGKKKFAAHEPYYQHLAPRLAKFQTMFELLVADDVAAYRLYQDSTHLGDGPEKEQTVQLALAAATNVPRETAKTALALLEDLREFAPKCSPFLITDLLAAAALAATVARLSDYNVRVNAPNLADRAAAGEIHAASAADLQRATAVLAEIEGACKDMLP
jgi:formiminotetrahydrofolate cyclodeaminase